MKLDMVGETLIHEPDEGLVLKVELVRDFPCDHHNESIALYTGCDKVIVGAHWITVMRDSYVWTHEREPGMRMTVREHHYGD